MVLPSENLQAALAGGLGRLDLSSDMFICADARVATAKSATAIKANFLIILFLLRAFSSRQSHSANSGPSVVSLNAECRMLKAASPRIIPTSPLQFVHGRLQRKTRRARALRTAHGRASRTPRCHYGPGHRRDGPRRAARRLLPEPALAGQAGHGCADHHEKPYRRQRVDSKCNGRAETQSLNRTSPQHSAISIQPNLVAPN